MEQITDEELCYLPESHVLDAEELARGRAKRGELRNKHKKFYLTPQEIQDKARRMSGRVLIHFFRIVKDDNAPASARVAAGNSILDRAYGKARTVISADEGDEKTQALLDTVHKATLAAHAAMGTGSVMIDGAEVLPPANDKSASTASALAAGIMIGAAIQADEDKLY